MSDYIPSSLLGFTNLCQPKPATVKSDAIAAIGIVKRQGLGRIRHLAVADLWIQQKSKEGAVSYVKLLGSKNSSDMHVDRKGRWTTAKAA